MFSHVNLTFSDDRYFNIAKLLYNVLTPECCFQLTDTLTQQHVQKQRSVDSEFYHLENECESSQTAASSTSRAVVTGTTQPSSSSQQHCPQSTSENGCV